MHVAQVDEAGHARPGGAEHEGRAEVCGVVRQAQQAAVVDGGQLRGVEHQSPAPSAQGDSNAWVNRPSEWESTSPPSAVA